MWHLSTAQIYQSAPSSVDRIVRALLAPVLLSQVSPAGRATVNAEQIIFRDSPDRRDNCSCDPIATSTIRLLRRN